ncbi:midcut-by-XrtH protein [Haliea atlantica]
MEIKHTGRLAATITAIALFGAAPATLAGGPQIIVEFGPGSLAVPTLGTTALIALGGLLAIIALRAFRGGAAGRAAAVALFSAGLISGGLGVERSLATSSFSVTSAGDCETGGTYAMYERGGNIFTNDCPNPMRILGYRFQNPEQQCTLVPNEGEGVPACTLNSPVASGGQCALPLCAPE